MQSNLVHVVFVFEFQHGNYLLVQMSQLKITTKQKKNDLKYIYIKIEWDIERIECNNTHSITQTRTPKREKRIRREKKNNNIKITNLGHIMCVGWFPIGKTVVTMWVVVACCGTNGLDGGTPPTANYMNWMDFELKIHCTRIKYVWWVV